MVFDFLKGEFIDVISRGWMTRAIRWSGGSTGAARPSNTGPS